MKRLSLIIFVALLGILNAQNVSIYGSNGDVISFEPTNKIVVKLLDTTNSSNVSYFQSILSDFHDYKELTTDMYIVSNEAISTVNYYSTDLKATPLLMKDSVYYWASECMFVKPKAGVTLSDVLSNSNIPVTSFSQFGSDPNVYMITTSDYEGHVVDYSNYLYETKLFDFAQPDWWWLYKEKSEYDLNDTPMDRTGIDMHIPDAWSLSTGTGVKVAVIDMGVYSTHPDLANNVLQGYDATDRNNGGNPRYCDCHGTACAGIIAALNNNIGITGVAYNAQIIPIRILYSSGLFWCYDEEEISRDSWAADGIRKAWDDYEADILNCSWATWNESEAIKTEVSNATIYGRGGKGSVVVFATANYNRNSVSVEAKLPNVIAVGAVSTCGARKSPNSCNDGDPLWGSNYGDSLCVMALGVHVETTTNDLWGADYDYLSGTSMACPYVSGLAALVLSANPNLTARQVKALIATNAATIRSDLYYYGYYPEYQCGPWNEEMGYGLINAVSTVSDAINMNSVMDLFIKDAMDDYGYEPYIGNLPINQSPDIWVSDINGDPVEQIESGQDYTINVKVRNNCQVPSSGNEILHIECYWAKPTRIMNFPIQNYFDPCLASTYRQFTVGMTQTINQGDSVVYSTSFKAPNLIGEGCMSANIQTVPVSVLAWVENEELVTGVQNRNVAMEAFARENNNAAIRDYTLTSAQYNTLPLVVDNVRDFPSYNRIGFRAFRNGSNHRIGQYATVYLKMSKNMYTNWLLKGGQGQGFVMVDTAKFRITDTSAYFDSIFFDAGEYETLTVEVDESSTIDPLERFEFDISQRCLACESYEMPEGRITIAYQSRVVPIKARAHSSQTIVVGDEVTLTSDDVDEAARYRWLSQSGEQLAVSQTVTVSPTVTQRYILEVMALSDSTKAYDTVTITVVRGHIETISPNPTSGDVQVVSRIAADVTAAQLTVSNSNGLVVRTVPVSTANRTVLNLQGLPSGLYYVQLGTSNEVFDVKTLIVR